MVAPLGIPAVYQMLVGAGALAGGAVATNQMRKEIQSTIDKDPGIMDQALKSVFMGPASQLINPNLLSEIQDKKPTTTDQGQKKAPPSEEDIMKGTLFYEQTPSGIVLGPTVGEIEKGREEARSKPLITIPGEVDTKPLSTPVPEKTNVLPGMDPAPTPAKTPGFSMPTTPDTSILTKDKPEETKNQIKTWESLFGDKFKNVEEVKQRSEKAKIPFEEVELTGIKEQIKFKKSNTGYEVYFDGKLIGDMDDITQELKTDNPEIYKGNQKMFNLYGLDGRGHLEGGAIDTVDTLAEAKATMKDYLAKGLLDKESSLRKNFENQKYDKKGNPLIDEKYKMSASDKADASLTNQLQPPQFKAPSEEVRNTELKLGEDLFKLSATGTVQDYETFKNNPIIQNKIKLSEQAYKDTTAVPNYGTSEYWQNRNFANKTKGYKELVKSIYNPKDYDSNKDFYIVMGPSSAGKSTGVVNKLQKETNSFLADSDEIKKLIPEFKNGYNASGVHKESSDINGRILAMAMKQGNNVIYPTTGREPKKLKAIIDNAEAKGYNVKVDLVTADRSVLLLRNLGRMLKTNRVVDGDKLLTEELINGIKETYNNLDEKYKRGEPIDTTPK